MEHGKRQGRDHQAGGDRQRPAGRPAPPRDRPCPPCGRRAERRGLIVSRASRGTTAGNVDVLLVDTIGELAALYALADAAFVGGSLVPVGGHNLLEPIAAGVPVLYGPHTEHVTEIAEALERSGAGVRVATASALGRSFAELALNPAERARRVALGRRFVDANRGALHRTADLILDVLDSSRTVGSA